VKAKRARSIFRCQACGHVESKWCGRCPACQEWSSIVEELDVASQPRGAAVAISAGAPVAIVDAQAIEMGDRLGCGLGEVDRVLGGGLVPGSLVLLGGEPGVGKSTLLLQMLAGLARASKGKVLYATGEESVAQTALRARRLGATPPNLIVVAETDIDRVLGHARDLAPATLAIDSIQTVYTSQLDSIPGAIAQVRECAGRVMQYSKTTHTPTLLVGHVTKDGAIAGPKTLEHLVDVVLSFEGDGAGAYRILRAHKNRFGSTQEIGVFEMRGSGLVEVLEPSAMLLAERPTGAPGSVVIASTDGNRPLLVEIQALVATASAGIGRRTAAGVDGNRVALLLAVLAQRAGCDVLSSDVFVNVAGGVKLLEPAIDLGIACAIASSGRGRAVDPKTVVFGEVGLAGEIRAVPLADQRLAEAQKLGFTRAVLPKQNLARLESAPSGMELVPVDRLAAALDLA
jgi:DNA repair protein RadA/Sms